MADPLYELLLPHLPKQKSQHETTTPTSSSTSTEQATRYLSRLLSLRPSDLTTTEPLSLSQASQSNLVQIQALSSRSHRTTTTSSDHLSTLQDSLPSIARSVKEIREAVPALDETAVTFASSYSKPRDPNNSDHQQNAILTARKESQLLARQADKLQDIIELPQLLSAAIASANSGTAGSANYSQALDLFAHIKRLQIIYPDSTLVKSVSREAKLAMKDMTSNLINSLRSQNLRLPAAIRTIGWLRRVIPEFGNTNQQRVPPHNESLGTKQQSTLTSQTTITETTTPIEGSFGLLFLTARLSIFLSMTGALSPLRDLADQETERRLTASQQQPLPPSQLDAPTNPSTTIPRPTSTSRRPSYNPSQATPTQGQQTERYLKRYIEIFREQSFSTIDMYRKIFPPPPPPPTSSSSSSSSTATDDASDESSAIPPALQTFPLHLAEILMETLTIYLPNVTDQAARESLLMQVLYAANSLGRLGADFSMMIALLDPAATLSGPILNSLKEDTDGPEQDSQATAVVPEWVRVIEKHRVQSARLDALAAGQEQTSRRESHDISVR